ncbi:putative protein kinase RLK-Pelle-WAK-LRK10L-1 family [Helianthus annuus]|uniref:Protein kinase domain-containing protein n=1 Tax=Helianthus annuus TaxID=4232 RepID=A0A9K3E0E4_HELAN|nr:wall-associated receptor kinase-like 14 [Helianthus annuus]KAF5763701.1 putative protein kinase RLK-Pelle-WAK-LRK10L-1 family [Helianthus annuus]KAJ0830430.1 putative protein kinase RLK-Pelle-WAK-LRK10L-1 family [Helianthus annuus]
MNLSTISPTCSHFFNKTPNMLLHLLFFSVILTITSPSPTSVQTNCTRVCSDGRGTNSVPYPFGFSDGCEIRLDCTAAGQTNVGTYNVQNITSDHMMVNFPANCDREFEQIQLFNNNSNFAITSRNAFLLEDCSSNLNDCVISITRIENRFNLPRCNRSSSMSCYLEEDSAGEDFLSLKRLETAGCRVLFSSVMVGLIGNNSRTLPVTMEFQLLELGWWVRGDCGCDGNAVCRNVSVENQRVGYRCYCNEGYAGDGFIAGDGCRRVKNVGARAGVLIGGIIGGASLILAVALICYCHRKRAASIRNQRLVKRQISEARNSFNVPFYHYREIKRATNSFSEEQRLGVGAYGTVYAGKLSSNEWVAVKKLRNRENDGTGHNQVMDEIKLISTVNHPNLVRLLGCCIEQGEQILVYEFMPNGTLAQHLQRERNTGLPWTVRLAVATETAQAIAYLHSMNPPIYHRDVKSSNILLDYNYKSKVADFGLSRLGLLDDSHISTAPQGTPGYVDPEYHQNFHLSDKSDVYSFGVVLVEIITALKVVDFSRHHSEINLAALAIDKIGKGCVDDLIDPFLEPNRDAWTLSSIHKVAELAFRCLAFHGDVRPSMEEVADELEQIRLCGLNTGDDNVTLAASSAASVSSSPCNGSEKSIGESIRKNVVAIRSWRFGVPHVRHDCLKNSEEKKDGSSAFVQNVRLSEQSSPSGNSLLGNVV